jgi:radical SAM superfamily enzyme YgiQ (UPF0313 family)
MLKSRRIVLLTPPTVSHRTAEETLALGYLAAVLRKSGYSVGIIDAWLEGLTQDETVERIGSEGIPSLLGFSCYRSNLEHAHAILLKARSCFGNIPAICGGYGPTFQPKDFLQHGFDVAVLGDAEAVIVSLVKAIFEQSNLESIPGIAYVRDGQNLLTPQKEPPNNLDTIPFPERDTIRVAVARKNYVHVCTSRGCEAHCSFCSIFSFAKRGSPHALWRQRSISNLLDEIRYLYEEHGVRHFKFVDDSFLEPPRDGGWASNFRDLILKLGLKIRFRTQVRADRLTSEVARSLKEAGWISTSVGIENGSTSALKRMRKTASVEDNAKALEILEENQIFVQMGLILFDPDTTVAELEENAEFLRKYTWPVNKGVFSEMYAAEGTPFTTKLKSRGLTSLDPSGQNYRYVVKDARSRRVYEMLKKWHRSHSTIYDWVIDSITAPKVLPDDGYQAVHHICQRLQNIDRAFLGIALKRISEVADDKDDTQFVDEYVDRHQPNYTSAKQDIQTLYSRFGLLYDGAANPFL